MTRPVVPFPPLANSISASLTRPVVTAAARCVRRTTTSSCGCWPTCTSTRTPERRHAARRRSYSRWGGPSTHGRQVIVIMKVRSRHEIDRYLRGMVWWRCKAHLSLPHGLPHLCDTIRPCVSSRLWSSRTDDPFSMLMDPTFSCLLQCVDKHGASFLAHVHLQVGLLTHCTHPLPSLSVRLLYLRFIPKIPSRLSSDLHIDSFD